ncbi:MAG TPA: polysaccharide deacetylase family protein [Lachnospiraceae bacterium]|nr:polysaccharide deacetylase family protein [Lachnospiraceae bacterium]
MREQLDKALDHLIALHNIEEKKTPSSGLGKAVGLGVFLLGAILLISGVLRQTPISITASSTVGNRELPIYCVETEEPKIALTFDAAWGNEDTQRILELLEEQQIKVTFFVTGGWVKAYPEDVKAILSAGHDLGNHSESHKNMSKLSDSEKKEEIINVHKRVKDLTGYDMFLFRPPYGDYDNALVKAASACGYYTIQWDVDSLDWKDYGTEAIVEKVCKNKHLGNGSIILCHNGAKYTADALETMIVTLKEKGFTFVTVSELIYRDNYHMNQEGRQIPDVSSSVEENEVPESNGVTEGY